MKNREALIDTGLLCLRLALGAIFILHGARKFFPGTFGGTGIDGFTKDLAGLQIPAPAMMAYVTAIAELGGGILVTLGIWTRIAALAIGGVMVVAIAKVHLRNGFWAETQGYEYCLALLAMSLALVFAGGGKYGLGKAFQRKEKKK